MSQAELEERLEELIEPIVRDEGVELVSVLVTRRGGRLVVSVCLDRDGGIDIDTCAELSDEIGRHMDVLDLIKEGYDLEVSSPGVDRVLQKPREYRHFRGREVEVTLREPYRGEYKILGVLADSDEEGLVLRLADGKMVNFPFQVVKKTRLHAVLPW
ncbi:MAG: ribosome maturation factor RimP [Candidatus Geothermincolales bacterium]